MATKPAKIRDQRPTIETVSQTMSGHPTAALLRIASQPKVEPLPARWDRIVPGVIAVFALLIGANYWVSERGQTSVAMQVHEPSNNPNQLQAAIETSPLDRPAPQLSFGLWPSSIQSTPEDVRTPIAAQPQLSALGEPPKPMPGELAQPTLVTVAEGQSLIRIAHANHVPAKAIAEANHLERPYRLKVGSQLLIPEP